MTRIGFILLLIWISAHGLSAQDLIVTEKGDSINATVTKIKGGYIHFVFNYKGEIRRTLLHRDDVVYQKDFYTIAAVPEDSIPETEKFSRYRFGLTGGLSYVLPKVGDHFIEGVENHLRDLKRGTNYGGEFDFFLSRLFGVGLRYRVFRSRAVSENIMGYDIQTLEIVSGRMVDDVRLQFFGLAFASSLSSASGKVRLNYTFSAGYAHFYNAGSFMEAPIIIKGESFGLSSEIGVDFMLDDNLALGISGSYFVVSFPDFDVEQNGINEKLLNESGANWSRADISLRLVWYH